MLFKKGYIFYDTIGKEKLLVIGNYQLRGNYYIKYRYLNDNRVSACLRDSLLKEVNNNTLVFNNVS